MEKLWIQIQDAASEIPEIQSKLLKGFVFRCICLEHEMLYLHQSRRQGAYIFSLNNYRKVCTRPGYCTNYPSRNSHSLSERLQQKARDILEILKHRYNELPIP